MENEKFDESLWNDELKKLAKLFKEKKAKNGDCTDTSEQNNCEKDHTYLHVNVNEDIDSYRSKFTTSDDRDVDLKEINKIIGEVFGGGNTNKNIPSKPNPGNARNEFGLMVLSKKETARLWFCRVFGSIMPFGQYVYPYYFRHMFCHSDSVSSCLYLGDLKFDANAKASILQLIRINDEELLMMQIPHHSSEHNTKAKDIEDIPSKFFFWHDKDTERMRANKSIMQYMQTHHNVFLVDEFYGMTVLADYINCQQIKIN